MAAASVHLTDRVLPDVPVRQFVLSVPYELRLLLASRSEVLSAVIRIVMRVVLGFYRKRGREIGLGKAEPGAVSFVQRSGGSLNSNPHLHSIAIDGIYTRDEHTGAPRFHFVQPPSAADLGQMVSTICERVCKMVRRRGMVGEANHGSNEAEQVLEALRFGEQGIAERRTGTRSGSGTSPVLDSAIPCSPVLRASDPDFAEPHPLRALRVARSRSSRYAPPRCSAPSPVPC